MEAGVKVGQVVVGLIWPRFGGNVDGGSGGGTERGGGGGDGQDGYRGGLNQ